ncbi:hypothetical protein [Amycolatopsis sp.]|uniref:hypothetical protein n=1 Tax=Amycolatopsis sp. TaxID=37632 RepID=UPI0026266E8C|nr:hypothetical protein [Amycolatopsis sp.]
MNPIWLTIVLAVLSPVSALAGTWIAGVRTYRLARLTVDTGREDSNHKSREDAYKKFVVAARAIGPAARATTDGGDTDAEPALAAFRDAGAGIDLCSPELADGPLPTVLDAGERLLRLALSEPRGSAGLVEAEHDYNEALRQFRELMRADLAVWSNSERRV